MRAIDALQIPNEWTGRPFWPAMHRIRNEAIADLYAHGVPVRDLATKTGVTVHVIHSVIAAERGRRAGSRPPPS